MMITNPVRRAWVFPVLAIGAVCLAPAPVTLAQQPPISPAAQPVRRGKVLKQPVIDLEKQAQARRVGQVMAGDPSPERFAATSATSTPPPAPPAPTPPSLPRESGQGAASGRPPKEAPTAIDPNSGPRAHAGTAPDSKSPGAAPEVPVRSTAPAPSLPETTVKVLNSRGDDAQWREVGGNWGAFAEGEARTGRFEVRTGIDGEAAVAIDDQLEVRIGHLTKLTIEKRPADRAMSSITLERGGIELRARGKNLVETWVRTPDRSAGFATLPGVKIGYSAFTGTSVTNPAGADRQ